MGRGGQERAQERGQHLQTREQKELGLEQPRFC